MLWRHHALNLDGYPEEPLGIEAFDARIDAGDDEVFADHPISVEVSGHVFDVIELEFSEEVDQAVLVVLISGDEGVAGGCSLATVTEDDIQRVAREYLKPGLLSMVLVGDASTFVNDLSGVGFDSYELVPITELDLSTIDFMIAREVAQGGEAVDVRSHASVERSRLEQWFGAWDTPSSRLAILARPASRVPILDPS